MAKVFKARCPKPSGWEPPTSMLTTRVDGWSLANCRCLGIGIQSQKSGVKSMELVVERSLKLDALNHVGWESSMDLYYMDTIEINTLSIALLQ